MSSIDPRLYGRAESLMEVKPDAALGSAQQIASPQRDVGIAQAVDVGVPAKQAAAIQQSASLIEPTVLESVGASMSEWDTSNVFRAITKPEFQPDAEGAPSAYALLEHVPYALTKPEQDSFMKASTTAERMWLLGRYQERRDAMQTAGEHPFLHMAAQTIDPAYLLMGGPAIGIAKLTKSAAVARGIGAAVQGVDAAAISLTAAEAAPVSNAEIAFNVLANMAAGAAIVKEGKVVPKDGDLPSVPLAEATKPPSTLVNGIPTPTRSIEEIAKDALSPPAFKLVNGVPTPVVQATDDIPAVAHAIDGAMEQHAKSWSKAFAENIMWNVNKTMRKLSNTGDEIGDLLTDNQLRYGVTSVESEKRAVKSDMVNIQHAYEDHFRKTLGERGTGFFKQLAANKESREASAALERDVSMELLRREQLTRKGRLIEFSAVDPRVKELADLSDHLHSKIMDELKAAGVAGSETVQHRSGYFHRSYSSARMERVIGELQGAGRSAQKATDDVVRLFQTSLRKENPTWTDELAHDVGHAIVSRVLRKGRMEDAPRVAGMFNKATAEEVRDLLKGSSLPEARIQRVVDVIVGKTDEAGKAPYLKHRVDLDYSTSMNVAGKNVSVADFIETNLNTIIDKHIDSAASQVAFARKGMKSPTDIANLRTQYVQGATDRKAAADLFDNVVAGLQGRPVGDSMPELMRNMQGYNRMITLGASGLWQTTEYSTLMAKYGMLKTLKYAMAEMPGFKSLMQTAAKDKALSRDLKDILTNAAEQNIRLRPYISRFEDNFEIPMDSRTSMFVQQGTQLVPYLNAMKFIHGHQARVHANLLLDVIKKAANGDAKAAEHLAKYGLESRGMDKLKNAFNTHGFAVDKWEDGVWAAVRPTLIKMTDESVLHQRMGDMPAFAQFSQAGKFIMTYRSFVLTAHNKILAGTMGREGLGAVALLSMYQFPLAMMATQVNEVANGRKPLDDSKLITKSIGQMGALGLVGEMWNFLSGNKREVGSPGLIPFDRVARAGASSASAIFGNGEASRAAQDWAAVSPLFSILPGWKMLQHLED